jgi:CMP-N-acetylneuraminic acid synthetase
VIAIIPARSGSKRVPGKNWARVGGKTLVERAVDCARAAFLAPIVVTDAPDLCDGLLVGCVHEPPELAGDAVPMVDVLRWVLGRVDGLAEREPVVLLQPTSPFREPRDVEACVEMVVKGGYDSVVSVVARNRDMGDGDFAHLYERNGAVYVTSKRLVNDGCVIGGHVGLYVMPERRSLDIDTPADMERAVAWAAK